jgi:predicted dehydrogenase
MLRFVMIGCGGFSRRYHVPTLLDDRDLKIVGIFDPYPTPPVAKIGAPVVFKLGDLPDADACLVTTPHTLHAAHAGYALSRGWATLIDKPFVMTERDARALIDTARARKLVNAVGFNRRLDRGCLRAREIVRAGGIGAVRLVQTVQLGYERGGWFLDPALGGGGAYTGRGTHMADIVPWLIEEAPLRVRSRVRPGPSGGVDRGGFIDVEFAGAECQIACVDDGWHMWDEVRIFGEDGLIELRRPLSMPTGWTLTWRSKRGDALEELAAGPNEGGITADFLAAARTRSPVACDFVAAMTSVRIVEAAYASAASGGKTIELDQTKP